MQKIFYKQLYEKRTTTQDFDYTPNTAGMPVLNKEQKINWDWDLNKIKVDEALKALKNNKSPGVFSRIFRFQAITKYQQNSNLL